MIWDNDINEQQSIAMNKITIQQKQIIIEMWILYTFGDDCNKFRSSRMLDS